MAMVYGIAQCDAVKKARAWLAAHQCEHTFIDFKKIPPTEELLRAWLEHVPLSVLLNKRGTTWRKLTSVQQAEAEDTQAGAIALMVAQPSVIKRPVLVINGQTHCGFDAAKYAEIFGMAD